MENSIKVLLHYNFEALGGKEAGIKFLKLLELFNYGSTNWCMFTDQVQIHHINEFFRQTLATVPNSTELSEWLEEGCNIAEYANTFATHWGYMYIHSGVFDLVD
jgi:hypothetical protein